MTLAPGTKLGPYEIPRPSARAGWVYFYIFTAIICDTQGRVANILQSSGAGAEFAVLLG
jgi:hypothetical protein